MEIDSIDCNECGTSDWSQVLVDTYPERRQDRDRTVKTVYRCQSCDAEGRHFQHNAGGPDTITGAFR